MKCTTAAVAAVDVPLLHRGLRLPGTGERGIGRRVSSKISAMLSLGEKQRRWGRENGARRAAEEVAAEKRSSTTTTAQQPALQ
jgi:hypothetical protein